MAVPDPGGVFWWPKICAHLFSSGEWPHSPWSFERSLVSTKCTVCSSLLPICTRNNYKYRQVFRVGFQQYDEKLFLAFILQMQCLAFSAESTLHLSGHRKALLHFPLAPLGLLKNLLHMFEARLDHIQPLAKLVNPFLPNFLLIGR